MKMYIYALENPNNRSESAFDFYPGKSALCVNGDTFL